MSNRQTRAEPTTGSGALKVQFEDAALEAEVRILRGRPDGVGWDLAGAGTQAAWYGPLVCGLDETGITISTTALTDYEDRDDGPHRRTDLDVYQAEEQPGERPRRSWRLHSWLGPTPLGSQGAPARPSLLIQLSAWVTAQGATPERSRGAGYVLLVSGRADAVEESAQVLSTLPRGCLRAAAEATHTGRGRYEGRFRGRGVANGND